MTKKVALLGLSGVGKTTFVARIQERLPVLHLQASALIKTEQARVAAHSDSSEALRLGAVLDNQSLMIAAFRRISATATLPVIFDAHSVIDGRNGLVEIPSEVFSPLGLAAIFFLKADPIIIAQRRLIDTGRDRPIRTSDLLAEHQAIAQAAAERIAVDIKCTYAEIEGQDIERVIKILLN
ncbi:ATP-binding protein [Methylobacterium brachiatum]|uniref:ATP-binding protein n=1 Tax=Methylobacterium brachiatum TaxID=269660 RepID=UPI000EFC15C6|nr:AAA family ATPase [Methylobacterium brachiatum]AYO81762.1 adenylate kinase [Methylobacterium brachiatum]